MVRKYGNVCDCIYSVFRNSIRIFEFSEGGDRLNNLKKMDLVFFSIISIIAELVTAISFANLSTGFYFSFAILIFIIFSIRWGNISIIALILSGIPLIFIQPIGNWQSIEIWKGILYYMVVNVFAKIGRAHV